MDNEERTKAELFVLGLLAEMPRHGYELERVIERRGMRQWTQIGFSSIYFVLAKLEKSGLVASEIPEGAKARKTFHLTDAGRESLVAQSLAALAEYRPTYSSVLTGMLHWPVLEHGAALESLRARARSVDAERERLAGIRIERQPLPDHVEALFEFTIGQLDAESAWIERTTAYMETKPRLDEEEES